jgi:hypothetical protein
MKCVAYVKEIPTEIWNSFHDHRKPFEGDNGVLFDPRPDTDLEFTFKRFENNDDWEPEIVSDSIDYPGPEA